MIPARTAVPPLLLAALLLPGCGKGEGEGAATPPTGAAPAAPKAEAGQGQKSTASAMLAYQTGLQLLLKGDPERAVGEFERAVGLDARMSEAHYELGKLQVHLSSKTIGSQARDLEILRRGIASLEKARDLEPANDHYWFWIGRARSIENDVEGARTALSKAVELNPRHAPAWKALGLVEKGAGQTQAARDAFQQAIQADPEDAGAFFQLGQTLEELQDLENARAAYEKSLAMNPTEPEVHGRLLTVCAALGDADCEARARAGMEAWTEYDRRLKLSRREVNQNPDDAKALRRLGLMYFEVGQWEEALEWFVKSIHLDPSDPRTHLYCGVTRRHLRDYVNAANHLKEAEFLAPDVLDPKLELLRLYAETEEAPAFQELLAKTESEAAADGPSLLDLGLLCRDLARADDAARLLEKAKALGATPDAAQGE
ncbi:MAG TPA: tetratricopeptide repeat protein [Planctomycetota bacterium]